MMMHRKKDRYFLRKATFYQMFAPLMKQHDIVSEFFPKDFTILSILII